MIRVGNERVLRARLADARFFWDQDRRAPLADNLGNLEGITFFDGLGTVGDKAKRLSKLAAEITGMMAADKDAAATAGLLAKADLVSETVGEFPELQGIIGGYLAQAEHGAEIADAISNHYRPEGPADNVPSTPLNISVALADKLDTLVGFFGVGAVPTGSKDPFALRRAALGILRIMVENNLPLDLKKLLEVAANHHGFDTASDLLMPFLCDRLKVWLRDQGIRHDIVTALVREDDPRGGEVSHIHQLSVAMKSLLAAEDGMGLMAGYKRASNILNAEEKKDKASYVDAPSADLFSADQEQHLFDAVTDELARYDGATNAMIDQLKRLGDLRAPIDAFFEHITVNDDDPAVRQNRLKLLGQVRILMDKFANFAAIEG